MKNLFLNFCYINLMQIQEYVKQSKYFCKFLLHNFDANHTSEGGFAPLQIIGPNYCYIFLMQIRGIFLPKSLCNKLVLGLRPSTKKFWKKIFHIFFLLVNLHQINVTKIQKKDFFLFVSITPEFASKSCNKSQKKISYIFLLLLNLQSK